MSAPTRQLFVTTALPYANGNFHIGHIMEYIQADIWVRFQRMQGSQVNFVGASLTWTAFTSLLTTGTAPTRPKTTSWPAKFTATCATSAPTKAAR
jgi:hypothetical protein